MSVRKPLKVNLKYSPDIMKRINLAISEHLVRIYDYNNIAKQKGYYLKPVHIVVKKKDGEKIKYYYYGRYWYKIEYVKDKKTRIKWIYMGKSKPDPELPDPPENPLEGLVVRLSGDTITVKAPSENVLKLVLGDLATSQ